MFTRMVEAKNISMVDKYYDRDFILVANGQTQDYDAFHAGHAHVCSTPITYAGRYDDEDGSTTPITLPGVSGSRRKRPDKTAADIEVMFVATSRGRRIHRLWELTWPDRSSMKAFDNNV
ncbi:nuclear transport factor 2 family protein [Gordonia oryzae]|uniref:nuclear transport factor 2 family protein n=1 Tax=Gordonia oryzae TaxID=2487349 RepID=UPI001FE73050|nr:nuclear transport factor 2 family protein [Gordonia oryzae]